MIFPRFSIRTLLAITALAAVLFVVLGLAFRGQSWAWALGLAIGVVSIGVTAVVHAAWFALASLFARLLPGNTPRSPGAVGGGPRSGVSLADEEVTP